MSEIFIPQPPKAKCVVTINPHIGIYVQAVTTGRIYPRGNQQRSSR